MMNSNKTCLAFVPTTAYFLGNGFSQLDLTKTISLQEAVLRQNDVDGIVTVSTTGFGPEMSHGTRKELIEETGGLIQVYPHKKIWFGTATDVLGEALILLNTAICAGYKDSVLVMPPAGSEEEQYNFVTPLARYIKRVGSPLKIKLYYHKPLGRTFSPRLVGILSDAYPTIVDGVKVSDSNRNVIQSFVPEIRAMYDINTQLFCGDDFLIEKSLNDYGASGFVAGSGNVLGSLGELFTLKEQYLKGDTPGMKAAQIRLNSTVQALLDTGNFRKAVQDYSLISQR